MPPLSNAKQELFCQQIAQGKTADEAYQLAGYKPNRANASVLKAKQNVSARIAELLNRSAARAEITIQSLTDMYLEDRRKAHELGQVRAAVSAADSLGKLHGFMIDRKEVGGPGDFVTMGDDELDRFIAERAGGSGAGSAREGIAAGAKSAGLGRRLN